MMSDDEEKNVCSTTRQAYITHHNPICDMIGYEIELHQVGLFKFWKYTLSMW
jgi:hypothetical protein